MKVVEKKTFSEYFSKMIDKGDGRGLIGRMQSLEVKYSDSLLIQGRLQFRCVCDAKAFYLLSDVYFYAAR